ncbi:HU family DNA-binding protein [Capnocytophaga sp. oral taxon 878]|uniref:HU family DNA-binding protein n=1 Tax=Capnocytophaga sp. oral taxon 878 TaxID=1316596 RepID=UPI000D03E4F8|nr:HU family DNA-binding protein [Capnocytophaga sp. oral taxon 878]AVM49386.1 DNA-binding protein [Capnocytophaga sp. oral taxon 878]
MNKTDLIDAIAAELSISKVEAKKAVEVFFSTIEKGLKEGKKVSIVGFGSWSVAEKEARDARNPRTGAVIKVPAKKAVKFKAGAELAEAVNK